MKQLLFLLIPVFSFWGCNSGGNYDFTYSGQSRHSGDSVILTMIDSLPGYKEVISGIEKTNTSFDNNLLVPKNFSLSSEMNTAAVQTGTLITDACYCRYH